MRSAHTLTGSTNSTAVCIERGERGKKQCVNSIGEPEEGSLASHDGSEKSASSGQTYATGKMKNDGADSSALLGRLKDTILSTAREEAKIQRKQFFYGAHTREGREKRKAWLNVEKELHNAQSLASRSVQGTPTKAQVCLLGNLREAIVEASHFLIEGRDQSLDNASHGSNPFKLRRPYGEEITPKQASPIIRSPSANSRAHFAAEKARYYVWSSPQAARCAIVHEAIAVRLKTTRKNRAVNTRPLVVLVMERSVTIETRSTQASGQSGPVDPSEESDQGSFLSSWTRASFGVAEVITVVAESSNRMRTGIEGVLRGASKERLLFPVLVCLHASGDSVLTSDVSSLRSICDSFGAHLCIEGSALSMIAQPNRPSDPDECVSQANVLLFDPGSWFGFKMCAVLTRHESRIVGATASHDEFDPYHASSISVLTSSDNDDRQGLATGPVLNLWTVLSRIGLVTIRSRIDEATALAEGFVHMFEHSSNVHALYDGIGCVIRISYAMSREDRLMTKRKAAENTSTVNNMIFTSLETESRALMVYKVIVDDKTFLQFSPSRLLRSGTFWIPATNDVEEYAEKVQETVNKYESCKAGLVAFGGKVAKCRDLNLIGSEEGGPSLALSFGAFRVVPYELCTSWRETSSSIDVVKELTDQLVSELKDSIGGIISKSFLLQRELERSRLRSKQEGTTRRRVPDRKEYSNSSQNGASQGCVSDTWSDGSIGLPFAVFLNSDLDNGTCHFLSVEPKEACRPVEAIRQAELAAELIVAAVNNIMCRWRGSNTTSQIPRDLANVAGREDFIPLTPSREGLGCVNSAKPKSHSEDPAHADRATDGLNGQDDALSSAESDPSVVETDSDDEYFYSVDGDVPADNASATSSSPVNTYVGCTRGTGEYTAPNSQEDTLLSPTQKVSPPPQKRAVRERPSSEKVSTGRTDNVFVEDPPQSLHMDSNLLTPGNQTATRSRWLGFWGSESTPQKGSSKQNRSEDSKRKSDKQGSEDNGHRSGKESKSDMEGAGSGGTSSSSSGSEDADEDESEEQDDDSEEETESNSSSSNRDSEEEGSDEESTDGTSSSRAESSVHSDQAQATAASTSTGFLNWFRRTGASQSGTQAVAAAVFDERIQLESNGSDNEDINTQDSEVPTDWVSRRLDLESMDEWDSEADSDARTENQGKAAKDHVRRTAVIDGGPSAFGFAWLRRRYLGNNAEPNSLVAENTAAKGVRGADQSANDRGSRSDSSPSSGSEEPSCAGSLKARVKAPGRAREEASSSTSGSSASSEGDDGSSAHSNADRSLESSEGEDLSSDHTESDGYSEGSDDDEISLQSERSDTTAESSHSSISSDGSQSTSYDREDGSRSGDESSSESNSEITARATGRKSNGAKVTGSEPGVASSRRSAMGRYLYWLAPSWTASASSTQAPKDSTTSRALEGKRRAQVSISSSESESDSVRRRGRRNRPARSGTRGRSERRVR